MSGHCPGCGTYAEEDDNRLCHRCRSRTNLQTMTPDQRRDWLAEQAGWKYEYTDHPGYFHWNKPGAGTDDHPFPATIDGAASALPEGWVWGRGRQASFVGDRYEWHWWAECNKSHYAVSTPDTGDEITDRYLLAALAVQAAMEAKK